MDGLRTEQRDEQAATKFLSKAMRRHGEGPETIPSEGRAANEAALPRYTAEHGTAIVRRKTKSLHTIIEQAHRAVKRMPRPMWGGKAFDAAQSTCPGLERLRMLHTGPLAGGSETGLTAAAQCYALAASGLH
jgi:transposase-like protein